MIITRTAFLILFHLFPSLCLFAQDHQAGHPEPYSKSAGIQGATGVLLLAHGGKENWNEEVRKIAASVDRTMPVEIAFGMAAKRNIQNAADRLVRRGAKEIVPVIVSTGSHPFPSRTRKLSLFEPMILHVSRVGK